CVAGFIGFCGPFLSLIAGGIAGYFAAQQEKPAARNEGARIGATAGGIAGGLIILGQILGGVGALAFMQTTGAQVPFGQVPSVSSDPATQVTFYGAGIFTALCFGIVGALLAAGAGALIAYFTTSDQPVRPPSQDIIS
ncbi:MAG TPA: hypothetical protein VLE49_08675, partial [Anaerolineales bacterium]|nr:hypothetical protein [Anaerolineales bacterium]